jgi:serine/threonine protein kinase
MAELFLGMPIFPGSSELNQVDTIFKILGTATKNQWREGYDLAAKRNYQFNVHKKIPLKFLFEELSQECVDMMEAMFIINPVLRPLAFELLKEPYFKNCNLNTVKVTHGNLNFGIPNHAQSPVVERKNQKANRL